MHLRSFEAASRSDVAWFQASFARLRRKTAAEPRASPRQLQHVNFFSNEKITGDLSDLKGLTRLGWTLLGQSGWALGVCRVSWSALLKHFFLRAVEYSEATAAAH